MNDAPSCPNCGHGFEGLVASTRMFDCPSCGTTLFREADALNPIGDHGEMHDAPMLVRIGDHVRHEGVDYYVIGHARFDYGRGWWDELWAVDGADNGIWISIDEGDVVIQRALEKRNWPKWQEAPPLGATFRATGQPFEVTEADRATCVAVRGQLPELLDMGETHQFVNAAGPGTLLLSGEFWVEDGTPHNSWFIGEWQDPFDLKVRRG